MTAITEAAAAGDTGRIDRSGLAWALYEGARNPYVIVCGIYVLAPYVASHVIGDPVEGQAQIADVNKWAGFAAALCAPLLGAAADRAGGRKWPLAWLTGLMVVGIALMWFITPPDVAGGLPTWAWMVLWIAVGLMFPLTEALHNAMLSGATTPRALPHVSGLALALGNASGVAILVFVLIFFAFPGKVDWPFIPATPAFGLDPAKFEPERSVTLLCALWFLVMAVPLFVFTRDTPRAEPWGRSFAQGLAGVMRTLRKVRELGPVGRFLLARMFYADAKTAIIVLGGVYVAGVMGWGFLEMTLYGIFMSIIAVGGGFLGGLMDSWMGPKRAIQVQIAATALGLLLLVSVTRDSILFGVHLGQAPVWSMPFFDTGPELFVLSVVSVLAVFITAAYASSRTLMTQLSPPHMVGELFGLYALAGTATVWVGPLLVSSFTRWTDSQQLGFGSLLALLLIGWVILAGVKPPPRFTSRFTGGDSSS
jgi:UMF1 family MFS transporter